MSHIISCDGGCGFTSDKDSDFEKLGVVFQKEYCESCALIVKKHLKRKDELHDRLVTEWTLINGDLKTIFKTNLPNGELPDE